MSHTVPEVLRVLHGAIWTFVPVWADAKRRSDLLDFLVEGLPLHPALDLQVADEVDTGFEAEGDEQHARGVIPGDPMTVACLLLLDANPSEEVRTLHQVVVDALEGLTFSVALGFSHDVPPSVDGYYHE